MTSLISALRSGRVLLMDGAMGTQFLCAGISDGDCYEAWNLIHPERVRAIHRSYAEAGAEILITNTFQANPQALTRHRLENKLIEIMRAGSAHARAALQRGWVLADIGPMASMDESQIAATVSACAEADGILLETFSEPAEATAFVRAIRRVCGAGLPVLVAFTFDGRTIRTFKDATPEQCASAAVAMEAEALGVNCGRDLDMSACAGILRRYRSMTELPLFARPNAGSLNAMKAYSRTAPEMAGQLPMLLEAGAVMVGGCCGTTPEHIRAFRGVVDEWNFC